MKLVIFTCGLLVLPCHAMSAPDSKEKPIDPAKVEALRELPLDATTAYGDALVPDADMDSEISQKQQEEQYRRGRMAFLFGQYKIAFRFWEPLAVTGYAKAEATMGWIYQTGKGAKKDLQKARYWYTRASYQSHEIALNNLGVFYEQGLGVGKNYQKAMDYYRSAANLGYSFAQYNLGMLYLNGHGVKKNKNKAIYWLDLASYQGVDQARAQLKALGRSVDIPQHKAVNDKIDHQPNWHKNGKGFGNSPHHFHQGEKPEHMPAMSAPKSLK